MDGTNGAEEQAKPRVFGLQLRVQDPVTSLCCQFSESLLAKFFEVAPTCKTFEQQAEAIQALIGAADMIQVRTELKSPPVEKKPRIQPPPPGFDPRGGPRIARP